jgi:hypothetical protein
MLTLMNYTFQSFNFRGKEKYRPFYDLICNIAAEEYSHIEERRRSTSCSMARCRARIGTNLSAKMLAPRKRRRRTRRQVFECGPENLIGRTGDLKSGSIFRRCAKLP